MIKKPFSSVFLYALLILVGACGCPEVSHATLLDLDALLGDKADVQILELFKKTEELQIGGTHTYGNRTVDKKGEVVGEGELDPRILIINPAPQAHAENNRVLGILGSGFDLELVRKLVAVCDRHGHRFKKVYINNLGLALPIADQTRLVLHVSDEITQLIDISEEQEKYLRGALETTKVALDDGIFTYARATHDPQFQRYLKSVGSILPKNIYASYFGILAQKGQFLFKSASLIDLKSVFFFGFLKHDQKQRREAFRGDLHLEILPGEMDKFLECKQKEDEALFQKTLSKLLKIGDQYPIHQKEYEVNSVSARLHSDSRLNIKSQVYLLKGAGFRNVGVSFGRFKDWGFSEILREEGVFSLVLSAEK